MPAKSNAAKLQAMMKNRKAQGIHEWKAKEEKKGGNATVIQAFFRGGMQRRRMELWTVAAAVLQAQLRGLVARRKGQRQRQSALRLQRVYRGAKLRMELQLMARALKLIQRRLRGVLARTRLHRQSLRRKRVVHSEPAIRRMLSESTFLCEVLDHNSNNSNNNNNNNKSAEGKKGAAVGGAGNTDNSSSGSSNAITWAQYRDNTTGKVWYLRTEHLRCVVYCVSVNSRYTADACRCCCRRR
jgi:hypothetical protein